MTRKIFLSIIIINFIAVIAAMATGAAVVSGDSNERLAAELRNQCSMLSAAIESDGVDFLGSDVIGDAHVVLEDKNGDVIFNSGEGADISHEISASQKLSDGSQLTIYAHRERFGLELLMSINSLLLAVILFALIAAMLVSRHIVKPINDIDLDRPKAKKTYKELSPLLEKLRNQNRRIYRQMEELRRSRRQFSLITESMGEGIVVADPKAVVLTCNSGACKLLDAEPLTEGQSIFVLCQSEGFRRCIQDAMGGRKSEFILNTDSGDRRIIASPASISETVNGIVVLILDVTEQQKLETMRREFTSNVSHELKTPLTTIYGIADMLANGMVRPEDVCAFGGDIRSESERLINLIGDIVALSKLDENSIAEQDEEVDLYDLAADVIERLKKNADEKNVSPELCGSHVSVIGNRTVLDEIICNLCDNAIKYNVDGGKFSVRISHIPTKAIITVRDTGIGIPAEHIDRIFERFYRADKSRSHKVKGTGLGLSIVKHGVSYHGGTVRAASYDSGTVFTVELPVERIQINQDHN